MATLISKTLLALGFAMAATTLCVPPSFAAETKKPAKAKAKAKAKSKAKAKVAAAEAVVHEDEPDVTDKKSVDFNCELGNKVTVYSDDADTSHIALRWKKRLHRLVRVGTTTGAQRFENPNFGLIWIGIPAKGMLLDSKLNRQLANECKNAEQENAIMAAPAQPDLIAPVGKSVVEPALPPAARPSLTPARAPSVVPGGEATILIPEPAAPVNQPAPAPAAPVNQAAPAPAVPVNQPAPPPAVPASEAAPAPLNQPAPAPAVPATEAAPPVPAVSN